MGQKQEQLWNQTFDDIVANMSILRWEVFGLIEKIIVRDGKFKVD